MKMISASCAHRNGTDQSVSKSKRLNLFFTGTSDNLWPKEPNRENMYLRKAIVEELRKIKEDNRDEAEKNVIIHQKSWLVPIQKICDHMLTFDRIDVDYKEVVIWVTSFLDYPEYEKLCNETQKQAYDEYLNLVHDVHNRRIQVRNAKERDDKKVLQEAIENRDEKIKKLEKFYKSRRDVASDFWEKIVKDGKLRHPSD